MKTVVKDGVIYEIYKDFAVVKGLHEPTKKKVLILNNIANVDVTKITRFAFSGTKIHSISIPSTIAYIEEGAFYDCAFLREITVADHHAYLPSKYIHVGTIAFRDCKNLKRISFCRPLILEDYCFSGCMNLFSISSIFVVNKYSFFGCKNLNTLRFIEGAKVKNLDISNTGIKEIEFNGDAQLSEYFVNSVVENDCEVECYDTSNICDIAYMGVNVVVDSSPF